MHEISSLAVHTLRVALFGAVLGMIHVQHQRVGLRSETQRLNQMDERKVQQLFGQSVTLSEEIDQYGRTVVHAGDGHTVGSVMQTSPAGDRFIGFSGATNLILGFDRDDKIVGVEVLSSADTRDHVNQIQQDSTFLSSWQGASRQQAASGAVDVDAVAGATLTSLAIQEAIIARLGGERRSLRFPDPPSPERVRRLFPRAVAVRQRARDTSIWDVLDHDAVSIGTLLRNVPAADQVIGYQGPTEALIGLDTDRHVIGMILGNSFDNLPYVSYVRDDEYFLASLNGLTLNDLATASPAELELEGVSGATMTSLAVVEGFVKAAAQHREAERNLASSRVSTSWPDGRSWGTILVVAMGTLISLTRLRGIRWLRIFFQCVLIGYLGLINGDLLSQALFVGWAQNGVPWRLASGLVVLTLAAFILPMVTGRNVYCNHLCPHGAAQQLLKNRLPWRIRLAPSVRWSLRWVAPALLLLSLGVGLGVIALSLVDIEPFDAWVFYVAGIATIAIAIAGLIGSLFVPMAYCRYGCPTGALLDFLRFHSESGRWTARDWFALACAGSAALILMI